uniref:Reverse transcriptase Ty1/copia-type domain-containing protein n=1 Tax=Amphimedon queenslandica TaxID=400682 RepID=A0A1X7SRH6_AMPQE
MGELSYFLGIKVVQDPTANIIWIRQPNYIESLISDFDMTNAKGCNTPINVGEKLSKAAEESIRADPEKYQSAVGRLLYLSTTTRPDIAFAVSSVAKYTSDPTVQHWKAVKHIIQYLTGTVGYGLMFHKKETAEVEGYSDADWAGDIDDRKSTSGYLFKLWSFDQLEE